MEIAEVHLPFTACWPLKVEGPLPSQLFPSEYLANVFFQFVPANWECPAGSVRRGLKKLLRRAAPDARHDLSFEANERDHALARIACDNPRIRKRIRELELAIDEEVVRFGRTRGRQKVTQIRMPLAQLLWSANRWAHRDATMILIVYRHGLRASEATDLRWDQVDFGTATLHVRRVKQGSPSTHPILGDELRSLRRLQREQEPKSPFVFTSERRSPFTTAGFARLVERAGTEANFGFKVHPHMLRHACGFALASKGHDTRALQAYLGHKNIQHTVRYTELSPGRFKDFWRD